MKDMIITYPSLKCGCSRFEKYVEYAMNVPLFMVYRKNQWQHVQGQTFEVTYQRLENYCTLPDTVTVDEVSEALIVDVVGFNISQDFMAGKLKGYEGDRPSMDDWLNHLGNLYPEVN